jgi:glutamine cyclotransferase
MKTNLITYFLCLLFLLGACKNEEQDKRGQTVKKQDPIAFTFANNQPMHTIGQVVNLNVSIDTSYHFTKLEITSFNASRKQSLSTIQPSQEIQLNSTEAPVGKIPLVITGETADGRKFNASKEVIFFSEFAPEYKSAIIVKEYDHAITSYTQGLEFYQGRLYEGTGQRGQSILAEIDLPTGRILRQKELDKTYFGEGITILNDTIYQITWQSGVCLLYNLQFEKIGQFTYSGDGWGLCNDGKSIIMSNGSDQIVWRNPRTFEIEKTRYVFDDKSSYINLNELELIDGSLYANVYTERSIIEIDTSNGKVLSIIDCNSLEVAGRPVGADVLNGIAHNSFTGKTYMTGKWWPKLFEVNFE